MKLNLTALRSVADFQFSGNDGRDTGMLAALLRREGVGAYPAQRGVLVLYVPNGRRYIDTNGVERDSRDERYMSIDEVVSMARSAIERVEQAHEAAVAEEVSRDVLAEMGIGQ